MLRVLLAAAEAVPFAKRGGLADVVGALPRELRRQGVDARVVLPLYGDTGVAATEDDVSWPLVGVGGLAPPVLRAVFLGVATV